MADGRSRRPSYQRDPNYFEKERVHCLLSLLFTHDLLFGFGLELEIAAERLVGLLAPRWPR